ncbi:MAG: Gfo/Idh/MocA family oxidoreductase [Magnetococcus sp. DMHC-6]
MTIGIACIGYGYWGPNLVRNFARQMDCQVYVVCDSKPENQIRIHRDWPMVKVVADAMEAIHDPRIDAVLLATPVATHHPLAMAALRAGKHVFVEKPLAGSVAEAEELVAFAASQQRILMVDHTFVYTPAVQKIHELIRTGTMGELYYYDSTRVNLGLFQTDVNVIWDLAVHDFAILKILVPEQPVRILANGVSHFPDTPQGMAQICVEYASTFRAFINVSWMSPVKVRSTLVGGNRRMLLFNDLEPSEKIRIFDTGIKQILGTQESDRFRMDYRMGDIHIPHLPVTEALMNVATVFLDAILHNTTPLTDGQVGLDGAENRPPIPPPFFFNT